MVGEGTPTAGVTVNRVGGSLGVVSVDYSTGNGTALAGTDYLATSGMLIFQDGETNKTFAVPILDDGLPETEEQLNLHLANHAGAYTVRVTNGQLRTAEREPASVEIGSEPGVQSQDKIEDLFLAPPNPLVVVKSSANAAGLISVRAGNGLSHRNRLNTDTQNFVVVLPPD